MTTDHILDRSDHYCIIGAGPAGLLAARSLKHARIPYEQFQQHQPHRVPWRCVPSRGVPSKVEGWVEGG